MTHIIALKILYDEHVTILKMIDVLKKNKDHFQNEDIRIIVDFFQTYADKCHHGKEEDIFFAKISQKKISAHLDKILKDLLEEHKKARQLVNALSHAKNTNEISKICNSIIALYTQHIEKENVEFFPKILEYFDKEEQEELKNLFDSFDRKIIHRKYLDIVTQFSKNKNGA